MIRAYGLGTTVLVCLLAVGLSTGCTVSDSTDIKTSGIWAHYTVEHDAANSVTVWGTLRVGGSLGNIVDLTAGEHLEVNGTSMTEWVEPFTNYHWSRAVISPTADGVYDIDFVRLEGEVVSSTVVVPDRPMISGLEPANLVVTDDQLTITWDTGDPGDEVDIFIDGDCIEDHAYSALADSGTFVSDAILDLPPPDLPADCTLTVSVRRIVVGLVNTDFDGGYTEGRAEDQVLIDYETGNATP